MLPELIFDLDGTLWDTCAACAIGWNNVLRRNGIAFREITEGDVRGVAGKPHAICVREVFRGLPEHHLKTLIDETSEEDNRIVAERGGALYPGVLEGLASLSRRHPLFIVSNCQAGYIETFLKFSGTGPLFRDHLCWGDTGKPKAENLRTLVERHGLKSPVYFGDTDSDGKAARDAGMKYIHVTYGFGSCRDPDGKVGSFGELVRLFS